MKFSDPIEMAAGKKSGYKKNLGNIGEEAAASLLRNNDYVILERNYRFGKTGEIDIIARKENTIIFAEVKNRNSGEFGGAYYSISRRKKDTLKKVAAHFLHTHPACFSDSITYRFDMIAIDKGKAEWIEDIFR